MCKLFSAVIELGESGLSIHHSDWDDSHSGIIAEKGWKETAFSDRRFARVELTPGKDPLDLDRYTFSLDDDRTPAWWDEWKDRAEAMTRRTWSRLMKDGLPPERLIKLNLPCPESVTTLRGDARLRGYAHALPNLQSIGGNAYLPGYVHALPNLQSIGGNADLTGYVHALPNLQSIGGYAYLRDYGHALTAVVKGKIYR